MEKISKNEIISQVAEATGMTKKDIATSLAALEEVVKKNLQAGHSVNLGFVNGKVTEKAAREGRNPQTGAKIKIAARKAINFKPSNSLKEAVNVTKKK